MNDHEPETPETPSGPNLKHAAIVSTVLLSAVLLAVLYLRQTEHLAPESSVVASIAPLHSLVSAVMEGVDTPVLLLPPGTSPHGHTLSPSENEAFFRANLIVWVDPAVESALPRMIKLLPNHVFLLQVGDLKGVTRLPARRGGLWLGDEAGARDHESDDGDHADNADHDPHLWLDTGNAEIWVDAIARSLATVDEANAPRYRANAEKAVARLRALDDELRERLAPVADVPYLVYHDAYRYLEARYGLNPVGAFTLSADRPVNAQRYARLRRLVRDGGVACLFVEPQFPPQQAERLVEESGVRLAALDPLGTGLAPGPDLYFTMMRNLGTALVRCLGDT
ncbi:MAG: zinc ABC transporter substrate-binding protein [Gammaproteobacteria bacterium]|nr:zinc ABC transporter substrate-binding protein [Gammaproteobacteria bacterium]